jgi:hypothetical protein
MAELIKSELGATVPPFILELIMGNDSHGAKSPTGL